MRYCPGSFVSALVGILFTILIVVSVTLTYILGQVHMVDKCVNNRCVFTNVTAPNDITCVTDDDCNSWTDPCQRATCKKEGTNLCKYKGAGDFLCICKDSAKGRLCERKKIDTGGQFPCNGYCLNEGKCMPGQNDKYICNCGDLWEGKHCQQRKINPPQDAMKVCEIVKHNVSNILLNGTWFQVARAHPHQQHEDACVRYNISLNETGHFRGHVNIRYLPMNRFSTKRSDWLEVNISFLKADDGSLVADDQPYLHLSDKEENNTVHISFDIFHQNNVTVRFLSMKMCTNNSMYHRQTFIALLADRENVSEDVVNSWKQTMSLTDAQMTKHDLPVCHGTQRR